MNLTGCQSRRDEPIRYYPNEVTTLYSRSCYSTDTPHSLNSRILSEEKQSFATKCFCFQQNWNRRYDPETNELFTHKNVENFSGWINGRWIASSAKFFPSSTLFVFNTKSMNQLEFRDIFQLVQICINTLHLENAMPFLEDYIIALVQWVFHFYQTTCRIRLVFSGITKQIGLRLQGASMLKVSRRFDAKDKIDRNQFSNNFQSQQIFKLEFICQTLRNDR